LTVEKFLSQAGLENGVGAIVGYPDPVDIQRVKDESLRQTVSILIIQAESSKEGKAITATSGFAGKEVVVV
jgi:hypothetical protein